MGVLMDVFEECGAYGNGYGWESVAASAVRAHAPEIADRIKYDPEAGMFSAHGNDQAALRRLGILLHEAYHDRQVLAELIRSGDPIGSCRALAPRCGHGFDKLAVRYEAAIHAAAINEWLRPSTALSRPERNYWRRRPAC